MDENNLDFLTMKKNAFVHLLCAEKGKKEPDLLKQFSYADLAARYELKIVDHLRKNGIEGHDVEIALLSAASLLLEALSAKSPMLKATADKALRVLGRS